MLFGKRMRNRREELGLTQAQLAEKIGVSSAKVISNWEKGINTPDIDRLTPICDALGMSVGYLIGDNNHSRLEISEQEERLLEIYRALDENGKKYLMLTAKALEDDARAKSIEKKLFLNPKDAGYENMRNKREVLIEMKNGSYLECAAIRNHLIEEEWKGAVSIHDLVGLFLGREVPTEQFYDAIYNILKKHLN